MTNLRVLFCSDAPWATSGYAVQTALLAPRLKDHCDLALLATFGLHGGVQEWNGIPVYPGGADAFSNDVIAKAARAWRADVIITLKDALVFQPQTFQGFRWCVPGHTLVTLADGTQRSIRSIVEGRLSVKVKAWNGKNTVDADILDYQCIPAVDSGEIIEIETETTKILSVTAENQVLILRNGVIDWIDAGSIVRGDVVYCNSNIPYVTEDNDGNSKGNIGQSYRSDERVSTAVNNSGVGIYCRDNGWRGDDIDHPRDKAGPLGATPAIVSSQYARGATELASEQDRYACERSDTPRSIAPVVQGADASILCSEYSRIPGLSYSQEYGAVSDYQARTGADTHAVYGESGAAALQRPIHTERDRFVAPSEGFEPETIRRVRRRSRPFPFVYDITTTAGNFIAGGILIHNCPMTPIDHDPSTPQVIERVRQSYRPIAYAPQGFRALRKAGLDPLYAPHGFDPSVFFPMDKAEARAALGLSPDLFLIGTCAVNRGGLPSRKAWVENLQAFAQFAHDKPNVRYFIHTDIADDGHEAGVPLRQIMGSMGILDKVLFCDQERYRYGGFPPEYMRAYYNSLDVLNAVSLGEGFGIPALEAQACSVPVIVGDWCAHEDLCFAGWKVDKSEAHHFFDQQQGYVFIPQPPAIARCMEKAYIARSQPHMWAELNRNALAGAAPYAIDRVITEHWVPLLDEVTRDVQTPRSRGVLRIIRREEVFS